tara:strand:+ start:14815 stop:15081 length:267 start_codon:yes stop_codon:yes gene_type:complete
MTTHVVGFKPPDKKWKEMKAVWDACNDANIKIPDDVCEYFGEEDPDDEGVSVKLKIMDWSNEYSEDGYELKVSDIPEDVKVIRFYNSY